MDSACYSAAIFLTPICMLIIVMNADLLDNTEIYSTYQQPGIDWV